MDAGAGTAALLDIMRLSGLANWGPYGFAVGVGVGVGIACMYIFCKYNLLLI
jgi:hypothetical protein